MCRKSTFLVILGWSCCNHIYLVSTLSKYQNNDKVFDWKSEHQANLHNVLMIEKAIATKFVFSQNVGVVPICP